MQHLSRQIWEMKYRLKASDGSAIDSSIYDSWQRVAKAVASSEKEPLKWQDQFYKILSDFKFLPAGRILAGAGSDRNVTLFNCFVMGGISDNIAGIFDGLREAALTMQQGGGIGYDFSTLRPKGSPVIGVGSDASGPISFMDVWDSMCRTIMSAGSRRGAMMGVIRCDHPDIFDFIKAKRNPDRLRMFNLSVLVSDPFMAAVKQDDLWDLKFNGKVYGRHSAREIWDQIMQATYAYAEPGVIFIDRINSNNNLYYCETINATNPCGEQPLPPYGACLLGSVNLAKFIKNPFERGAFLDLRELKKVTRTAVRFLDNVIDISGFPLEEQRQEAILKRRIGLGITGLADALLMCGTRYGSEASVKLTKTWLKTFEDAAYNSSIFLAAEKGAFPLFDRTKYLNGKKIQKLSTQIQSKIKINGIRNALITSVAPTGTISLLADNVSSGLEPVFSFNYERNVLMPDGTRRKEEVFDYGLRLYQEIKGKDCEIPSSFVSSQDLSPEDHLIMQATVQEHIDSSISKTINVPHQISYEDFKNIYMKSYDLGCKGCTTFRPNDVTGAVLQIKDKDKKESSEENNAQKDNDSECKEMLQPPPAAIVQMFKPLDRPGNLGGKTYKLKWPGSDHAIYITINDVVDDTGRKRPFEIFINSKNMEYFSWAVALTRMISAVFRRGGDVTFIVEELKAVFDPRGGQWMKGKYVPSLLAAIGDVIERHMIEIGFLRESDEMQLKKVLDNSSKDLGTPRSSGYEKETDSKGKIISSKFQQCPKCGEASIIHQEGCDLCTSCSYSKCG